MPIGPPEEVLAVAEFHTRSFDIRVGRGAGTLRDDMVVLAVRPIGTTSSTKDCCPSFGDCNLSDLRFEQT